MKQKLLHIMMGQYNPDLKRGLDSVFECVHFDWLAYGTKSPLLQINLLGEFNRFQPDIVFMHIQSGEVLDIQTIQQMASRSMVFNFTGDVRYPLPNHYLEIGRNIKSTLFTNMNDVDTSIADGINADYLQVGFDSQEFNPMGDRGNYPEILFLGSNYSTSPFPLTEYRYNMVKSLKAHFGNKVGVYGNGWAELGNGNITTYSEEGKAYRSCKIAINLSHFAYRRYSSDRLWRILGSGAFCLTHRYPEMELDFIDGQDVIAWDNINDLIFKVNKYLNDDNERGKVALNGCFKARTKHTWHHFAKDLKTLIDKYK